MRSMVEGHGHKGSTGGGPLHRLRRFPTPRCAEEDWRYDISFGSKRTTRCL